MIEGGFVAFTPASLPRDFNDGFLLGNEGFSELSGTFENVIFALSWSLLSFRLFN